MMHHVVSAKQGKTAMVYAASGGVGTALLQLCRIAGVRSVALERKTSKMDYPKAQGADLVVCTSEEGWQEKVKAFTGGRGVDYVFNPVAGDTLRDDLELLATLGQIVVFGMLGGTGSVNLLQEGFDHFGKSASIHFSEIYATYFSDFPKVKNALIQLYVWLAEGKINPVYNTLPLAQAAEAHSMIQKGEVHGKMLLVNG
jgi:NADPH:quinone reductase-like Zn-dependent oxidoreductase